ncbi:MAG: hypothetical protein AVDCRST_MAG71-1783 [uncultured Lysobacter sp.]|uniref:Uncharacterized protein n=1 Tax=uncultured Lysobacter sp. TaxID=271060 RepID=A0A6J4LFV2_9GAMM|nr:MAG: hypothetical protein AVDCRST_MAG71-1783 [uncultured Lysobacter sp.]
MLRNAFAVTLHAWHDRNTSSRRRARCWPSVLPIGLMDGLFPRASANAMEKSP